MWTVRLSRSAAYAIVPLLLSCSAWAQTSQRVLGEGTVARREPTAASAVVGTLSAGDEVRVRGSEGSWRRVTSATLSAPAWVPAWTIAPVDESATSPVAMVTTSANVNVRSEPSSDAALVAIAAEGMGVDGFETREGWRRVRLSGSRLTGWVPEWALAPGTGRSVGETRPSIEAAPDRDAVRYVNGDSMYLRSGPSVASDPSAILTKGTIVYPQDVAGEWVRVRVHEGPEGWICRIYLSEKPDLAPAGALPDNPEPVTRQEIRRAGEELGDDQAMVYQDQATVRSGPSEEWPEIGIMPAGAVFRVMGHQSGWYDAQFPDGTRGWIASWLCIANRMPEDLPQSITVIENQAPPPEPAPATPQMGAYLAWLASTQAGKPYIWGAESPSVGFDCSGLLYWAHAQVGIRLPRTTFDQWKVGRLVPADQLQPGDCLYFNNKGRGPEHCGMYMGSGWFLHAPGRGKVVRYQPLRDRARDFVCARRMY